MSIPVQFFFTSEDFSSLPVPITKFDDNKSDQLGQLCVNPDMMKKKIKEMKFKKHLKLMGYHQNCLKKV